MAVYLAIRMLASTSEYVPQCSIYQYKYQWDIIGAYQTGFRTIQNIQKPCFRSCMFHCSKLELFGIISNLFDKAI